MNAWLRSIPAAVLCLVAAGIPFAASADAPPALSFVDRTARLDYGQTAGSPQLDLKVEGLAPDAMKRRPLLGKNIYDVGSGGVSVKDITFTELPMAGTSTRFFRITLPVTNMPRNALLQRALLVSIGGADKTIEYTLTNQSTDTYKLDVKVPPPIAIDQHRWVPVTLIVGPIPASNVTLSQATLIEKSTKRPIATGGLRVCKAVVANCPPFSLPAGSATPVWIGPVDTVGSFESGTVTIASDQKPEGDTGTMTVYVSSLAHRLWGVAVIFAGVVLAWFLTSFVRNLLTRLQLLALATALRETLAKLRQMLPAQLPPGVPALTMQRVLEQYALLDVEKLEAKGLPAMTASPWSVPGAATIDTYRAYVQAIGDWTAVLAVTVPAVRHMAGEWSKIPAESVGAATALVTSVDALAKPGTAPALATVELAVDTALNAFAGLLTGAQGLLALRQPARRAVPSSREVAVQIAWLGAGSWLLIGAITTIAGAYTVVFNAPGFGTPLDYFSALFWGLGLPAASQLVSSSSVFSAFKVTMP